MTTLLRGENDSKQSDEIQAIMITSVTTKEMETKLRFPHLTLQKDLFQHLVLLFSSEILESVYE